MATNILLLCYICLFFYFSLLRAEISPGRRHPELRGPPRGWDWDQAVSGFKRQPVSPTLQGLGRSFSFLSFLNKRQSGDCPIEVSLDIYFFTNFPMVLESLSYMLTLNSVAPFRAAMKASHLAAKRNAVPQTQPVSTPSAAQ